MPTGIELSSGVVVGSPKPLDAKFGPYNSGADALSDISAGLRYRGLTVGVYESGVLKEYWFKDGTANGDFVFKSSDISWETLTGKPSTFTPSTHSSTHRTGSTDALQAHEINGQTIFSTASALYNTDQTLPAIRARQLTVATNNVSGVTLTLPTESEGALNGDTLVIIGGGQINGPIAVRRINLLSPLVYETLATITATGQQYRFRSGGGQTGNWSLVPVDTHGHTASQISDSTAAGRALLTAASVQAQRTALQTFVGVANFAALPTPGVTVSDGGSIYITNDNGRAYVWNGTAYIEISPFPPVELVIACSDETSNLTTGTAKVTFRAPYAFTLTGVRASVNTAPTGSTLIVDINEGGTSVLSTKLSIDASEKTSTTAASAAVISDSSIADDSEITIDIDQVGSSIAGKGLKVVLIGTRA